MCKEGAWLSDTIDGVAKVVSLETLHEALKVLFAGLDVHGDGLLLDVGVRANHHDVGRRGKLIDEADELLVAHDHRLELVVGLDAAELELLDDVGDFLEPMVILVVGSIEVRNHQERALLEEDDLVGANRRAEPMQRQFKLIDVG